MTQAQHSTLALGVTAIGILSAGAFNVWADDRFVASVVFLGAVPLLTSMILVVWVSQVVGMLNVGRYLLRLETSIAAALDHPPTGLMTWEADASRERVLSRKPTYAWHYVAVLILFAILMAASIVLGAYRAWDEHESATLVAVAGIGLFCLLVFSGVAWAVGTGRSSGEPEGTRP